jgi:hypothetical protein
MVLVVSKMPFSSLEREEQDRGLVKNRLVTKALQLDVEDTFSWKSA